MTKPPPLPYIIWGGGVAFRVDMCDLENWFTKLEMCLQNTYAPAGNKFSPAKYPTPPDPRGMWYQWGVSNPLQSKFCNCITIQTFNIANQKKYYKNGTEYYVQTDGRSHYQMPPADLSCRGHKNKFGTCVTQVLYTSWNTYPLVSTTFQELSRLLKKTIK